MDRPSTAHYAEVPREMAQTISGTGVSGGEGRGVLVEWPEDETPKVAGAVVLLSDLDTRVSLLVEASAIVSEAGGVTSHGAVLARELQIPCVVVRDDAESLHGLVGEEVFVDAWEGTVKSTRP